MESYDRKEKSGDFVISMGGRRGGYRLSRKPEDDTVFEILEQMEESLAPVACLKEDAEPCPRAGFCKTLPLWSEFNKNVHAFFVKRRLSDLL